MTRRALLHSGGNARGALAIPVLEHLAETVGVDAYDAFAGVSVGAINVPEFASGNIANLRTIYEEVDGIGWYLRMLWPWQWMRHGIYSLDRLGGHIDRLGARFDDLPDAPVYAGVYDYQDDVYRSINAHTLDPREWQAARLASAAIPVVMAGVDVHVEPGTTHRCYDGGMRMVIPDLPGWETYDEIDVILCSPIDRQDPVPRDKVDTIWETIGRSVDVWIDGVVQRDLERLQRWAAAGVRINLYAPREAGGSFDASPETIRMRFDEGAWMAEHPVSFGGHAVRERGL